MQRLSPSTGGATGRWLHFCRTRTHGYSPADSQAYAAGRRAHYRPRRQAAMGRDTPLAEVMGWRKVYEEEG